MHKTLGILGGGQLGRMSAQAAGKLGIRTHVFAPEADCPASMVSAAFTRAEYNNRRALKRFASKVDVVTYELENIPVESVLYLQEFTDVLPDMRLLEVAQDRVREKQYLNDIGIPTALWTRVDTPEDAARFMDAHRLPRCVLKTTRFGYDGKGQATITAGSYIANIWESFHGAPLIAEAFVPFLHEISVVIARDKLGQTACYPPSLNRHENHVLAKSIVPAPIDEAVQERAKDLALLLAESVDLVGVLALEFFVTEAGDLLANEIAPRPHNSGHWTMDACTVSQFEQHVRAVCGLPVGLPERHSDAVMINLLGKDVSQIAKYLEMPNASVHIYGKGEIRDGRKMGHVNILRPLKPNGSKRPYSLSRNKLPTEALDKEPP